MAYPELSSRSPAQQLTAESPRVNPDMVVVPLLEMTYSYMMMSSKPAAPILPV